MVSNVLHLICHGMKNISLPLIVSYLLYCGVFSYGDYLLVFLVLLTVVLAQLILCLIMSTVVQMPILNRIGICQVLVDTSAVAGGSIWLLCLI